MTKGELYEIEKEVDQINSEMDWRCPNKESLKNFLKRNGRKSIDKLLFLC